MKYTLMVSILFLRMSLYAGDWPREVLSSEGTITMYQPQIESYSGNSMKARAAVSIVSVGKNEPVFGALWITCRVLTDRPTRTVKLEEMEVRRIRFAEGTDADTAKIAEALEEVIPRFDLTFSLDLLLESIETVQKERETARELEVKPPKIIIKTHPAVLVQLDGDPILTNIPGTSLQRVVNTPYFLVQDINTFFLRGGDRWFTAKNIAGPWRYLDSPPGSVLDLFDQIKSDDDSMTMDDGWKTGKIPEIIVSTEPAELIATDGPMQFVPIQGTGLLYASNTPGRLFLEIKTQNRFILISGRWYTAKSLAGPWVFIASEKLPIDFKNIPPGSECDDVLASVAGTIPAKEAIFDAQIPQMAEVDRAGTTSKVEYDGDPQFEPIEHTGMDYAVNTSTAVIRVLGRYYNCDRGVWFESATPFGPWDVCIVVPEIIYTIPSRCPIYYVRYVRVYHYSDDVVYVGYTAGYTGCYVYGRTVVYGTGYNYRRWYKHSYYARPWTWGFNVRYDPWSGWSFGSGWGQSHGSFVHHSDDGDAGWWGPEKYQPAFHTNNQPVYREGYQPVQQTVPHVQMVKSSNGERRIFGQTRSATMYDNRTARIRRPIIVEPAKSAREANRTTPPMPQRSPVPQGNRPVAPSTRQPEPLRPTDGRPITRPVVPSMTQPEPPPVPKTEQTRPPDIRPITRPVVPPATQPVIQPNVTAQPRIVTRPSPMENNVYVAPNGNIMRNTPQGWQQRDQNTWKQANETPAKQATVRDSEVRQRATERVQPPKTPPPATRPASDSKKEE